LCNGAPRVTLLYQDCRGPGQPGARSSIRLAHLAGMPKPGKLGTQCHGFSQMLGSQKGLFFVFHGCNYSLKLFKD
jgi:hypothetical protein